MKHLKNPPLVMSGLALGTLSFGNLLATYVSIFNYLGILAALFIYGILLVGMVRNLNDTKMQLRQPLIASVFPTFFYDRDVVVFTLSQSDRRVLVRLSHLVAILFGKSCPDCLLPVSFCLFFFMG